MLFCNGKPKQEENQTGLTPEMLKMLIEGVSAKVSANLQQQQTVAQTEVLLNSQDAESTLQRLAKAMASSGGKIEGQNFENLGEVKNVGSDVKKTNQTLDLLKDIK